MLSWMCSYCCPGLQCGYEAGLSWRDGDLYLHCLCKGLLWTGLLSHSSVVYDSCWIAHQLGGVWTAMMSHPPQCSNISFVATFTNTANRMTTATGPLADMTSTLTITAVTRLNETVVQCRGSTAVGFPINSSTVNVAGTAIMHVLLLGKLFLIA